MAEVPTAAVELDQFNSTAHLLSWWLPEGGGRCKSRKHLNRRGRESFLVEGREGLPE